MLYERMDIVDDRILEELLLLSKDYGGSCGVGSLSVYPLIYAPYILSSADVANVLIHLQLNSYTKPSSPCSGLHDVPASSLRRLQCSGYSGVCVQPKPLRSLAKLAIFEGHSLKSLRLS
jgi:hypothetical protein